MIAFRKTKRETLPNTIVIGAQKCATRSLHYYMGLHPQISMARAKELEFFVLEKNWDKGVEWYKSNFSGEAQVRGEASPNYTNYPFFDGVPERMYSLVPDAKLIYILRDPLERIVSHYVHFYANGIEDRTISNALVNLENNDYVSRSQYFMQVEQYLSYFPASNILIITLEDLMHHRLETLQTVFRFLNVNASFQSQQFQRIKHPSNLKRRNNWLGQFMARTFGTTVIDRLPPKFRWKIKLILYRPFSHKIERPQLDEGLQAQLMAYLKDDINRLRDFTGRSFESWCV